jgi:hypothetical protein
MHGALVLKNIIITKKTKCSRCRSRIIFIIVFIIFILLFFLHRIFRFSDLMVCSISSYRSSKKCTVKKCSLNGKFRKICETFMQAWVVRGTASILTTKIILKSKFSSAGGLFLKTTLKVTKMERMYKNSNLNS